MKVRSGRRSASSKLILVFDVSLWSFRHLTCEASSSTHFTKSTFSLLFLELNPLYFLGLMWCNVCERGYLVFSSAGRKMENSYVTYIVVSNEMFNEVRL
jgi:hypothetical protein